MENATSKKPLSRLLILLMAVIMIMAFTACGQQGADVPEATAGDAPIVGEQIAEDQEVETEAPAVPLPTNYIVLSYPAELENEVKVTYEDLDDGQMITFTTDFTGEELMLFRFSISASGDDGFPIGVLKDEKAGELVVCVHVEEHTDGNWKPEDFNKLNAMQERVNDIIVQFHEDPRFVPNR